MLKRSMVQILIIIICFLATTLATAQDYVVTVKNDTIPGKVKLLNYGQQLKVQLTPAAGKRVTYDVIQVKAFTESGEIYHTVRTSTTYTFMKLLRKGYLSLYAAQVQGQLGWEGRYLVKLDGSQIEVPNLGFKKRMSSFLSDCNSLAFKLEKGELGRSDLETIITEYNACIGDKSQAVTNEITTTVVKTEKVTRWNQFEKAVQEKNDLDDKSSVLEMVQEVKTKIQRGEKIPNFLLEGLRSAVKSHPALAESLEKAIAEH